MLLFLGNFVAFIMVGLPVALALGVACAIYLAITGNTGLLLAFPQRMVAGVDVFVLMTIPLFLLAGNLMNAGGITDRIVAASNALVGHVRGGLALVNVVASMFFSGVSGAATADSSALGTVLIPAMVREGYDRAYAAALTAVSSVIGPIIPPSIAMIIFGVLSGVSISKLFLAGVVPGLLLGFGLLGHAWWHARRRGYPVAPRAALPQRAVAVARASPALLLPVIILGGILSGVFTPTESAAVAAIYALLIGTLFYRAISPSSLGQALGATVIMTSSIMFIVAIASMVSFVFAYDNIPADIARRILELTDNRVALLLLVTVFLLLLGLFLEPLAAMILSLPVLLPIVQALGIDPVHFGVIVVLNLAIGLATPPVGLCLFVVCAIGKVPLERVSRASMPMLGICLLVLLTVIFVPELALFLPSMID